MVDSGQSAIRSPNNSTRISQPFKGLLFITTIISDAQLKEATEKDCNNEYQKLTGDVTS